MILTYRFQAINFHTQEIVEKVVVLDFRGIPKHIQDVKFNRKFGAFKRTILDPEREWNKKHGIYTNPADYIKFSYIMVCAKGWY